MKVMDERLDQQKRTFTEEIEIAGNELVERVKAILAEGNVRQLRLKAEDGDIYLETPLTIGVLAGGAVALAAPWLAILGGVSRSKSYARKKKTRDRSLRAERGAGNRQAKENVQDRRKGADRL